MAKRRERPAHEQLTSIANKPRSERLFVGPTNKERYTTPEEFTDWPNARISSRVACGVERAKRAVEIHLQEERVDPLSECLQEARNFLPWLGEDNPGDDANQKG